MKKVIKTIIGTSMLAFAMGSASQVNADSFTLPAGLACPDFDLTIDMGDSLHSVTKLFVDENGEPVWMITAGKGVFLEFTNEYTGATYLLKGNGSVSHTTFNPDGTTSVSAEGHNVLILFPTDIPAGPSTIQYVGRVTYTIDADGNWTLGKVTGKTTDICAALSE